MMMTVALCNLSTKVPTSDDPWAIITVRVTHPLLTNPLWSITMNHTFDHFTQAVNFIMSEFELTQDEAFSFVVQYMQAETTKLTLDISPLAFGTYEQWA